MALRVLTYNVRALRDDPAAVARVIAACRPDVACLQELPRFPGWRARRRGLARAAGLVPAVDRRAGGVAVWVRPGVPVAAAAHRVLRRYAGLHVRALALAVVAPAGRPLVVGSIHLDLHAGARLAHTAEALDLLRSAADAAGAPRLLAGDVNCAPGSAAWRELTADLVDTGAAAPRGAAATFTARRPRSRIDAVFASSGPAVRGAGVPVDLLDAADVAAASDHRPVLAEIEV